MTPVSRAFVAGAILMGNASRGTMARTMGRSISTISELLKRVKNKAEEEDLDLWDESLYEIAQGRGRHELLTQEQKDAIVRITTQDRAHREEEA